eukprot:Sspe_Gene.25150::Locus_10078_Transcript_2_6_Confidence_0.625_Length_492::g.25150::m.25150
MGHGPSRVHVEDSWEEAYETDERLQQAIPDDFVRVTKRQNTWFMKHYSILTERLAFLACQEEEDAITDEYREAVQNCFLPFTTADDEIRPPFGEYVGPGQELLPARSAAA